MRGLAESGGVGGWMLNECEVGELTEKEGGVDLKALKGKPCKWYLAEWRWAQEAALLGWLAHV